jgi:DNA-3-methyladenine glycosylase II
MPIRLLVLGAKLDAIIHHKIALSIIIIIIIITMQYRVLSIFIMHNRALSVLHFAMVMTRKSSFDSSSSLVDFKATADTLLKEAGILRTETKAGWCLKEGLIHVLSAENGKMLPLIQKHGAPKMYDSLKQHTPPPANEQQLRERPSDCFQSLCRIIAGQQLAGASALAMWNRLLTVTDNNLTPELILKLEEQGLEDHLRKPVGLSNAKARSIVALAQAFQNKELSEDFLTSAPEAEIRESLLLIKGIGPWSCDMFLMFVIEHADVFPVGDLGVRSGMAKYFSLKGTGKGGNLCQKKDLDKMQKAMAAFEPYRSLASYYMWKVADTKDFYDGSGNSSPKPTDPAVSMPVKRKGKKVKKFKTN